MKLLEGLPDIHLLDCEAESRMARSNKTSLVLHTMREAFIYAKKCCNGALSDDDIYSLCYRALMASARRYKPARGRFFAYSKVNIRGQISREFRRKDVVKNASMHESDETPKCLTPKHVLLEGFTHGDEHETDIPSFPDLGVSEPEFDAIEMRERMRLVRPLIKSRLTKHERMVIELRYDSGFDLQKIGDLLGVSRQAVEHHHSNAIMKLRRALMLRKQMV
jgi:RNA polymerase sigma factor (sigma-70 family)